MLTASKHSPNNLQSPSHSTIPTPKNWRGVKVCMEEAERAVIAGKLQQAESILIEMLEFAPSEYSGWKRLAHIQRDLGKIHAGIASARQALQLQQREKSQPVTRSPASLTLAKLHWQQGEREEALTMLATLLQQQPQNETLIQLKQQWEVTA